MNNHEPKNGTETEAQQQQPVLLASSMVSNNATATNLPPAAKLKEDEKKIQAVSSNRSYHFAEILFKIYFLFIRFSHILDTNNT